MEVYVLVFTVMIQLFFLPAQLAKVGQLSEVDHPEDKGGFKGPSSRDVAKAKEMEEKHLMLDAWKVNTPTKICVHMHTHQ